MRNILFASETVSCYVIAYYRVSLEIFTRETKTYYSHVTRRILDIVKAESGAKYRFHVCYMHQARQGITSNTAFSLRLVIIHSVRFLVSVLIMEDLTSLKNMGDETQK